MFPMNIKTVAFWGVNGEIQKKGTAALVLNIRLHSLTHATV